METQLQDKNHPVRMLTDSGFNGAYLNHYERYVDKKAKNTTNIDLLNRIIAKTVGLQTEYVFKMAEKFDSGKISLTEEHNLQAELNRKSQITLGNQAIDDVKVYFASLVIFLRTMYSAQLDNDDYEAMQEDLAKLIINMLLQGDVLKVLICLVRIDCFD